MEHAYALLNEEGRYVCIQGQERWTQIDCAGWAVCDPSRKHVEQLRGDGEIVVKMIPGFVLAGGQESPRKA